MPLNEGRSVSPGDTRHGGPRRSSSRTAAQRRPERQPRRHVFDHDAREAIPEGRSTKAGASAPATPEPRARRSTKAGASAPATRIEHDVDLASDALNEGRSVSPGDTPFPLRYGPAPFIAQRRPERQPRRHERANPTGLWWTAQRRPERQPRRHTLSHPILHVPLNEGRSVSPGDTCPATAMPSI